MDFGMPFLLETRSLEEGVELCQTLGLQFIELNMNFPQCQLEQLDAERLNEIRQKTGLYFTIHLDENLNISDFNMEVREAYLRTVENTIALARRIEAPIINMHLAKGIYITLPEKKVFLFEEYSTYYMENMYRFRNMCEKALEGSGIRIAVENTDGFMEHEKRAIEFLLESKVFGLTLDIGHSHAAKDMDLPFFDRHKDKLLHMHAHDAKGKQNHLAFGDGEIDLQERLGRAKAAGARVVLETKTIEALTNTVQKVKSYLGEEGVRLC